MGEKEEPVEVGEVVKQELMVQFPQLFSLIQVWKRNENTNNPTRWFIPDGSASTAYHLGITMKGYEFNVWFYDEQCA